MDSKFIQPEVVAVNAGPKVKDLTTGEVVKGPSWGAVREAPELLGQLNDSLKDKK